MKEKLKILFCTDGIFPHSIGGMQRHSRLLIESLVKTKEVELVVLHPHSEAVFLPESGINEIKIPPIDVTKNYLLECYNYSKRIYEVILQYPDHIVYSQGLSTWYGIKKISSKIIVNPHGLEPFQSLTLKDKLLGIPFRVIFNYLFRHAVKVVSLGGELTMILKKNILKAEQKIIEIPNAVLLPRDQPLRNYSPFRLKLLFVARFAHNKGIHILLEAIKQLNEEGYIDKLEFTLGGKGPLFQYYSTTYVFSNVNYCGFVTDEALEKLYKTQDVFIFPTLFEGMPTVVLEAMSYGLPVIVSDVGATAQLVDDTNGYLISKNSTTSLKNAIISFYKLDNTAKIKLSETSFQKVKNNYTWEIVTRMYIDLFENISKTKRVAPIVQ